MTDRDQYTTGPASGAQVRKDGEKWTLILTRELRHSPEKVWQALTDPSHFVGPTPEVTGFSEARKGRYRASFSNCPTALRTNLGAAPVSR